MTDHLFKDFLNKAKRYHPILFFCLISTLLFFDIALLDLFSLNEFWFGLSSGFVVLIFTIFIIDVLLEKRRASEIEEATGMAKRDLNMLTISMVLTLASNLGEKIDSKDINDLNIPFEDTVSQIRDKTISKMLQRDYIKELISYMEFDRWKKLEQNLSSIYGDLNEILSLYRTFLSPTILGKLLKIRNEFKNLHSSLSLLTYKENKKPDWYTESSLLSFFKEVNSLINAMKV